jgi:hypothetical protein
MQATSRIVGLGQVNLGELAGADNSPGPYYASALEK